MREIASPLSGPFTTFGQTPIDIYKVGAYRPELAYSFYNDYYRRGRQPVNFLDAITHTRNGNATMTGDYGPELVTNGDFSSGDLTGWDSGPSVTPTYVDGALQFVGAGPLTSTAGNWVSQDINLEENKAYEISYDAVISSGGSFRVGHGYNQIAKNSQNGSFKHQFTAINNFSRWDELTFSADSGATLTIDNISVREVPKIQWAPHNLLTYSEDFSNWPTKSRVSVSSNAVTAPDGLTTADKLVCDNTASSTHWIGSNTSGSTSGDVITLSVFLKAGEFDYAAVYSGVVGKGKYFDLANGVVLGDLISAPTSAAMTSFGDGWYLCQITVTAGGNEPLQIYLSSNGTSIIFDGDDTSGIYIWGAHLYRSDLGGMADVPASERAFPTATKYVSTTDAARYLPRRGHHVYNGSQWVNKGLLVESEARTNLVTYSEDFTDAAWSKTRSSITPNAAVGLSGDLTASKLVEDSTASNSHQITTSATTTATVHTFSVYAKPSGRNVVLLYDVTNNKGRYFNVSTGVVGSAYSGGDVNSYGIEDVGNGWHRIHITFNATSAPNSYQLYLATDAESLTYSGDGASGIYIYGAQLEAGSTPSSYLPTNGASVTRPAETLTIPAENLPWPEPVVIGEELVTNGTFDTDSDWTKGAGWTISGGVASFSNPTGTEMYQSMSLSAGVYKVEVNVTGSGSSVYFNSPSISQTVSLSDGSNTVYLVHNGSYTRFSFLGVGGSSFSLDNISVKEINPLALSIQMSGEVTGDSYTPFRWYEDSNNYITQNIGASDFTFTQADGGTVDSVTGGSLTSGVSVAFDFCSTHASTLVAAAVDGTSLTDNTTPVALTDLSSTDVQIGYDFNGTIDLVRIWSSNIAATGREEAST